MHYLDHAATAPVREEVAEAVKQELMNGWGNPSSQYAIGREAAERVASYRATIAKALGGKAERLYFTSCGTESDNWAIRLALHQNRRVGKHIITTAIEHSAVRALCKELQGSGYEVTMLAPDKDGVITAEQVAEALREDTALVSMMLVNNELGTIQPVEEVAALLKERRSAALLHTDAVQAFMEIPFSVEELGADLVAVSAHKIGAPKGIGALYMGSRIKNPQALLYGGGQEKGLRPGTEATAQIAGFAKAVELRSADLQRDMLQMHSLKGYAMEQMEEMEGVELLATGATPHILPFSLVGYPSQNVVTDLSEKGIYISAGSACHQGKASHVIEALRLPKKVAAGALRVSFGPDSSKADVDALLEALKEHRKSRFPML
ncbi:MAG: cysteine desulfurase [Oscillospiraceae bacterium]|nr:cysteine desulfurase [Oscillospiraceae bacterium]